MNLELGRLLSEARNDVAPPASPATFAGVDGRTGPAVDRLNISFIEMLQADLATGTIPLNERGEVRRKHYADRLGVHSTYLVKLCAATLDAWDAYFRAQRGGLRPVARAFVDAIKADLASGRGVALRGKHIETSSYAERLGLTKGAIVKSMGPELKRLEEELRALGVFAVKPVTTSEPRPRAKASKPLRRASAGPKAVTPKPPSREGKSPLRNQAFGAKQAAELQHLIERDHLDTGVRLNQRGQVDRQHYAAALGSKTLAAEAGAIVLQWNERLKERNGGLSPIGRRFLEAIEADKASATGVVATEFRIIDLSHYAKELGVSGPGIRTALGDRLSSLNKALAEEGALHTPLEKRLLAIIDQDLAEGKKPKVGRGGKLDRPHYAELLGVGTFRLRSSRALDELDRRFGASSKVEARLGEMKCWLEEQYEKRTLLVRDGRVDRKQFQTAFNLTGGTFLVRYAGIRALFDEFDSRVVAENYRPAHLDDDLQRLTEALAADPELNKDRLTINRTRLAERLGLSLGVLTRGPFGEKIRQHDAKTLHRAKESLIDPLISGRVFSFSDLPEGWSELFLAALGSQFKKAFGHVLDPETLKAMYLALHDLLGWIAVSDLAVSRQVVRAALDGQLHSSTDWARAVFAYREHLVAELQQGVRSKGNVDTTIRSLRRVLLKLDAVFPPLQTELPGIKYARAFTVHRPSVAEANQAIGANEKYIEFASSMLRQAADRYKVDLDHNEGVAFTDALAAEMERSQDLPNDPAHAILLVLDRRLSAIRDAAVAIFERSKSDLEKGQALLKKAQINGREFYRTFKELPWKSTAANEYFREWLPNPAELTGKQAEAARQQGIANLLAIAVDEFDGFLPGNATKRAMEEVGQFFQKRYLELGSKESLAPLLNPNRDATGAALTLYLVESGANVSVGRTLEVDCIEPASQTGYKLITGHKARAKGKPIYAELPSDSPAILALEWYAASSERFRAKVEPPEIRSLFLHKVGEQCQLATPHWYTNWFKSFASGLPALAQASITPSMLRPSVLLKAALENDGRLQVGRAIGQHSQAVTRGYQEKLPIRLLRDEHMRRFQRHYETRVLQNVVDVAQSLGISAEEFEQRVHELQASGLGTFCVDPYARPGSEGQRCRSVDCWRECPQLLVVANVEAIALLQIWQKSLEDARGDWERDHPERWGEVWLPWLCLTEVVQKRMSRGALLLTWKQAEKRAAHLRAEPNFIPPRPF